MTDLRERMPAQALVEKVVSLRGTPDVRELPWGVVRVSRDALAWLRGIRGEQEAARRLASLGAEWVVIHSVPIGSGDSDIDHLLVGPGGIFTINSKRHLDKNVWVAGGRLLINGQRTDHIRNAAFEASRVSTVLGRAGLGTPVVPVVAISGAKSITVKAPPEWRGTAVEVLAMRHLPRFVRSTRVLSPDAVAAVASVVVRPESWSHRPASANDLDELRRAYAFIDRGTSRWNLVVALAGFLAAATLALGGYWLLTSIVPAMLSAVRP